MQDFEKKHQQMDPTDLQKSENQRWDHSFLTYDLTQSHEGKTRNCKEQ